MGSSPTKSFNNIASTAQTATVSTTAPSTATASATTSIGDASTTTANTASTTFNFYEKSKLNEDAKMMIRKLLHSKHSEENVLIGPKHRWFAWHSSEEPVHTTTLPHFNSISDVKPQSCAVTGSVLIIDDYRAINSNSPFPPGFYLSAGHVSDSDPQAPEFTDLILNTLDAVRQVDSIHTGYSSAIYAFIKPDHISGYEEIGFVFEMNIHDLEIIPNNANETSKNGTSVKTLALMRAIA